MKITRHLPPILRRTTGLFLSSALLLGALPAIAQSNLRLNLPDLRAPGNRESGSTRSNTCIDPEDNLIALTPDSNYGLTQEGYPTFYAYLPANNAKLAKFIMYNEETNDLVYEGQFSIKGESGIVGVSLPDNGIQRPLEVGESYVWYLTLVCDPAAIDQSGNAVIEATVARVTTLGDVAGVSAEVLPSLYAEAGLWYDALDASADLKHLNNDASWNFLLNAVELDDLIPMPVLSDGLVQQERVSSNVQ